MKEQMPIVLPKQPFFVLATHKYYKVLIMKYGISHFYSFEVEKSGEEAAVAIPDGTVDILFCCDPNHPWANVCGTVLSPHRVFYQDCHYFGVRFMPGVIPDICSTTMAELLEREIPLQEIQKDADLFERIVSTTDFEEQQRIFLDFYMKHYLVKTEDTAKNNLNDYIVKEIVGSAGGVTVADLAEQTCYSERYVNKVFKESFGIVPKTYCKLMRFQYLLDHMDVQDELIDLAALSLNSGFYDQSHMIKNFKAFTSTTPQKYLSLMRKEKFHNRLIIVD